MQCLLLKFQSHSCCFPGISLLLGAWAQDLSAATWSSKGSGQLAGQSRVTSWKLHWGSLKSPRAEKSRVPRAQAKIGTAAASLGSWASSLRASGKDGKTPRLIENVEMTALCSPCRNPQGVPARPCLVAANLTAHTPWGWRGSPGFCSDLVLMLPLSCSEESHAMAWIQPSAGDLWLPRG